MKVKLIITCLLLALATSLGAQNPTYFREIVSDLSSARFQGRGYAKNGVIKAGKYINKQFRKVGADEVIMQPFAIDINTFAGKMELSADGRKLRPGDDFTMREFSPGCKGEFNLYYIDTLNYDSEKIFADLEKPENRNAFVVADFWFTYKHSKDFRRLESADGAPNAGVLYTWDTPLKFYKAYGETVKPKPILWGSPSFPRDAKRIKANIENRFYPGYISNNVIAKIEGRRHDKCYAFIAHYDHMGNLGSKLFYPGANDNASGVATLITIAQYYAQNRPEYDMYFLAVSGEEAGLRGSTWFVENPTFPLESIIYLFDVDMVGDNNPVQYCEVSDPGMSGFRKMEAINAEKHYFKELNLGTLAANSDHWPFAEKGVPCIMFENENGDAFPFYHTHNDNMQTFRMDTYEPIFKLITDFIN